MIVSGAKSKATTVNPKDLVGNTKVAISRFPVIGTIMGSMAMMDGADKYGPYNWRDKDVIAHIYVDAMFRHIFDWWEGQERASDSLVHHLGHLIACAAILLDAQATGHLIDDRPIQRDRNTGQPWNVNWLPELLDQLSATIKAKREAADAKKKADERRQNRKKAALARSRKRTVRGRSEGRRSRS